MVIGALAIIIVTGVLLEPPDKEVRQLLAGVCREQDILLNFGIIAKILWRVELDDVGLLFFLEDVVLVAGYLIIVGDQDRLVSAIAIQLLLSILEIFVRDEANVVENRGQFVDDFLIFRILVENEGLLCPCVIEAY